MFEKTRNLLSSLGFGSSAHPKNSEVQSSPAVTSGLYDHGTDVGHYVGVQVPPLGPGAESTIPPHSQQHGDTNLEHVLASTRREVLPLRKDVGVVMRELLVAGGRTPEAAGKLAGELLR